MFSDMSPIIGRLGIAAAMLLGTGPGVAENLARGASAEATSARGGYPAAHVVDGKVSDTSRWLAEEGDRAPAVVLRFPQPVTVGCVDIYSGWRDGSGLARFDLELETGSGWQRPAAGRVRGTAENRHRVGVRLGGVRALRLGLSRGDAGRIREIAVYADPEAMVGQGVTGDALPEPPVARDVHQVAVNQVGYVTGRPKRFTAPLSQDGTALAVRGEDGGEPLFRGTIRGGIGDFSDFRPADSGRRYVVEVRGGSLKDGRSDPFLVRSNLLEEQFWQAAVDFLIDSRSVVGTHPSAYGGCPWRDGTYYDAILPSLVLFYLADPARVEAMPRQVDWAADKARVTAPGFRFDAKNPCSEGVMDAVRNYYGLEAPKPDAPDVVKLIHWGAGYYLMNPATRDPSGDPDKRRIHSQTVEQVAYVVWAWPRLKQWLPESFHEQCRDFCFQHWEPSLEVDRWWDPSTYLTIEQVTGKNPMGGLLHPYKGRHAPGHSIVPNLLMHEVVQREGRGDAGKYLEAAVKQAAWCVEHLDWRDPRTTKGQRMSEHRTIPNLVWLLQKYPDDAPPGLKEKISAWVDVAIERSDNLWDFRRYDMGAHWTIPKLNDVGNALSLPAIAAAASWVVDADRGQRLEQIAMAAVDHVFGRNPRLAAAPSQPAMGFPEIERGWPKEHPHNICARLELCRGSISASPGSEMFPFHPEGGYRHAEGWVNYGASWCISLAYLRFDAARTTP